MHIYSVEDSEFLPYGKVHGGYDTEQLLHVMNTIPHPAAGTDYQPSIKELESLAIFREFKEHAFGGMPIELGMCWGYNRRLSCLEYHRDSEFNIGATDFILLVARREEIEKGKLDTTRVKAFRAPAGAVIEVFATTLHYAPCHVNDAHGFRVAVVLPLGTNHEYRPESFNNEEDKALWARNKWLYAHADAPEAKSGAYVGLIGKNIDLDSEL